jgi:SAM-dependent methyltransferase
VRRNSPSSKNQSEIFQKFDQQTYFGVTDLLNGENNLLNYNNYIIQRILKFTKSNGNLEITKIKTLDFGAGIGVLANIWFEKTSSKPMCLEVDPSQSELLSEKGYLLIKKLADHINEFDVIYSSNVLEHIEDDSEALREMFDSTRSGGILAVYVPAFQILFSDLDRSVGHYRRYSRKNLSRKVQQAGYSQIKIEYVDSLGFFASIALKVLGYKGVANLGGSSSLKFYDKVIFPVSLAIDRLGAKYFIGKNLLLFAIKEDSI